MAERKGRTWKITLTCVGLNFRWKRATRNMMPDWCPFPVTFEREPDNRFDANAVKVVIAGSKKLTRLKGKQLGYLRAGVAAELAPKLDAGTIELVKAWITEVDPEGGDATIDVRFRDKPAGKRNISGSSKKSRSRA